MLTPTPRPPTAYADAHWLRRGRELLRPPKLWTVAGFPGYTVDEFGTVFREAYITAGGRRRPKRALVSKCVAGTYHYRMRQDGREVAVSQRKLRTLLVRA